MHIVDRTKLTDFGTRYAAAWSSQNPVSLASFYTENGSLTVNGGAPSVGRKAITETARGFMTAFPDMVVKMDEVEPGRQPRDLSLDVDRYKHRPRRHWQTRSYSRVRGVDDGSRRSDRGVEGPVR